MGPRQWTYGQRSRSNPRSHSGSLHGPHLEDFNFEPRIDSAEGCAVLGTSTDAGGRMAPAGPRCTRAPVGASRGLRTRLLRPARQVDHCDRPPIEHCSERGGGFRDDDVLSPRSAPNAIARIGRYAPATSSQPASSATECPACCSRGLNQSKRTATPRSIDDDRILSTGDRPVVARGSTTIALSCRAADAVDPRG
jgi:hypothetical protein